MMMYQKLTRFMCLLALPVLLAACGEGWSVAYTKDILPYGNSRTAGSGVIYVRDLMMPAKCLKLEKHVEQSPAIEVEDKAIEPEVTQEAFDAIQVK